MVPFFAAHGDYAEIGVGGAGLRINREDAAEGGFGGGQVAGLEGGLAHRKRSSRIDSGEAVCVL